MLADVTWPVPLAKSARFPVVAFVVVFVVTVTVGVMLKVPSVIVNESSELKSKPIWIGVPAVNVRGNGLLLTTTLFTERLGDSEQAAVALAAQLFVPSPS